MSEVEVFLEEHDLRFAETETESKKSAFEREWAQYINREN